MRELKLNPGQLPEIKCNCFEAIPSASRSSVVMNSNTAPNLSPTFFRAACEAICADKVDFHDVIADTSSTTWLDQANSLLKFIPSPCIDYFKA